MDPRGRLTAKVSLDLLWLLDEGHRDLLGHKATGFHLVQILVWQG